MVMMMKMMGIDGFERDGWLQVQGLCGKGKKD